MLVICPMGSAVQREVSNLKGEDFCKGRCGKSYTKYESMYICLECRRLFLDKDTRAEK